MIEMPKVALSGPKFRAIVLSVSVCVRTAGVEEAVNDSIARSASISGGSVGDGFGVGDGVGVGVGVGVAEVPDVVVVVN